MMRLPKLYPIVDRATLDARGISVGAFAAELAAAGVEILQYRDKVNGPQEVLRAAAEISKAFAGRECRLVMNDRADLAVLAGWGEVHVGQDDMSVEDVRRVLSGEISASHPSAENAYGWGTRAVVGVSTHTVEQVRAAEKVFGEEESGRVRSLVLTSDAHPNDDDAVVRMGHPDLMSGPNYVAVGPVFGTATKLDAEAVVGLEGVRRARALTTLPLVAIGGITQENARSVMEAGADSVAVIGGLFREGMSVRQSVEDFLVCLR